MSLTLIPNINIDNIFIDNPTIKTFIFPSGYYYLTDILKITKNNIKFQSLTKQAKDVHIFQTNSSKDGIAIINCSNVSLTNISIHDTYSGKIALTGASINNCKITGCYFYGCDDTFTIYFAGPRNLIEGSNTLEAYNASILDNNNLFKDNTVYTKWSGDSVSYSLQDNGNFISNVIRGGKVAVYMCKNTIIRNNTIYDSTTNGLYISLPSHNLNIDKNKIYECKNSAIKISDQVEHGTFISSYYDIKISNNYLYDAKIYAFEINNGIGIEIFNNKAISTDIFGLYLLNCDNITVYSNKFSYFTVALWLENTTNSNIYNNRFYSVYPNQSNNVIKCVNNSNNTQILNNIVKGKILYDLFPISNSIDCVVSGNNVDEYYTHDEEIDIMK